MTKYCHNCKTATPHSKEGLGFSHLFHGIVTLFFWPWLAVWILHGAIARKSTVCSVCGSEN